MSVRVRKVEPPKTQQLNGVACRYKKDFFCRTWRDSLCHERTPERKSQFKYHALCGPGLLTLHSSMVNVLSRKSFSHLGTIWRLFSVNAEQRAWKKSHHNY